ncbi:CAP domain-containing protein [Alkalihalobacillus pseudalcaliphilus]|uniref:CAP domain-containing protein n=1 Tax=Alkalihalobacillus pseudalcaliphilus TaxID=79884 RepID=UPI00064E1543|nr:CAP domain-containing protein [Alkalihalobacillus pseudalcaliphilus]KMK74784.1 hypothetical protein AB990_20085 [Alkalihalobacillus pseudalcaliphilus]
MKKMIATSFLAATIAVTGFSAQADAHHTLTPIKKEFSYQTVQLNQADMENLSAWAEGKLAEILNGNEMKAHVWKVVVPFIFGDYFDKDSDEKKPIEQKPEDTVKEEPKEEQVNNEPKEEIQSKPEEKPVPKPEPQPEVEQPKEEVEQPAPAPEEEQPVVEEPSVEEQPQEQEQQASVSAEEQQMVDAVNQERQQRGLAPLKINQELTHVARVKAQDMIDNNYFAHNSPTYGSPFDMLNQFGISYRTAGENLAGNQNVNAAHQALMNSQGHRENILNGNYTEVGIGVVDGGPYGKMFVQLFKG